MKDSGKCEFAELDDLFSHLKEKNENLKPSAWCDNDKREEALSVINKMRKNCDEAKKSDLDDWCKSHSTEDKDSDATEHFTMMNDEKSMNSILVFGLFIVLFSFVYIYGFHGILKFEKNLNYLIAILFSAFGIILSIMLIIGAVRHVSSNTMSDEDKVSSRNGLLVIVVLIIFFSMMAIIRYNYGKLFNALNKALPVNKPPPPPRGRGRGKRR